MYRHGNKAYVIAKHFGVDADWLKRRIIPGYSEKRNAQKWRTTALNGARRKSTEPIPKVPKDTRSFTARFCGDPLPGRSALDRMKGRIL
jgi:hypothetical protein